MSSYVVVQRRRGQPDKELTRKRSRADAFKSRRAWAYLLERTAKDANDGPVGRVLVLRDNKIVREEPT